MDLKTNDKVKIVKIALPTKYENTTFPFYEEINHGLKINEVEKRYILKSINRPMDLIPKIFYISDLHFDQKLSTHSQKGMDSFVKQIRNNTTKKYNMSVNNQSKHLFIAGDICRSERLFTYFIKSLHKYFDKMNIFIILGNHELSTNDNLKVDEVYKKYKNLVKRYTRINIVQNELISIKSSGEFTIYNSEKILKLKKIRKDCYINCFCGTGFAGLNENWNCNNKIYGKLQIDREQEIELSSKFNTLLDKCNKLCKSKNLLVVSHFPVQDCITNNSLINHNNIDYFINGHTHRNYINIRDNNYIYYDNQIGYKYPAKYKIYLKSFFYDDNYLDLNDKEDGIYEISYKDYKNILKNHKCYTQMRTKKTTKLYMLKRERYKMFIRNSNNTLCIMSKGNPKKLPQKELKYFYDNMLNVVKVIKKPYEEYLSFQEQIAKEVRRFGGCGYIHGCIIDIDFNNHIYVNPLDKTITPYYATDMTNKWVYKSLGKLLKEHVPELYNNYKKMDSNNNSIIPVNSYLLNNEKELYLSTNIYTINYYFNSLSLIEKNIISRWIESDFESTLLLGNNKSKVLADKQ